MLRHFKQGYGTPIKSLIQEFLLRHASPPLPSEKKRFGSIPAGEGGMPPSVSEREARRVQGRSRRGWDGTEASFVGAGFAEGVSGSGTVSAHSPWSSKSQTRPGCDCLQRVQNSVLIEIPWRIGVYAANGLMLLPFHPWGCDVCHKWGDFGSGRHLVGRHTRCNPTCAQSPHPPRCSVPHAARHRLAPAPVRAARRRRA